LIAADASVSQNKVRGDDELCKVCMNAVINCILLECGHMVSCTDCGRRLAECPICRRCVSRVVHVFRAWWLPSWFNTFTLPAEIWPVFKTLWLNKCCAPLHYNVAWIFQSCDNIPLAVIHCNFCAHLYSCSCAMSFCEQGDYLSPGNAREFDSCHGSVREFGKVGKILSGKNVS